MNKILTEEEVKKENYLSVNLNSKIKKDRTK
jgi:hypothetical protein